MKNPVKKWMVILIVFLLLSGCSWNKVIKWFDEMEVERNDETIRVIDIFIR
ncbi:MAG: hypothetical protein P8182_03700 [Deltaproteobacteria bacterium]